MTDAKEPPRVRRAYTPPKLTFLGTVQDLTCGVGSPPPGARPFPPMHSDLEREPPPKRRT